MNDEEKNKIEINTLLEIIYERYKEDVRGGKLRVDLFRSCEQAVGKSDTKTKTFQQPEILFEK